MKKDDGISWIIKEIRHLATADECCMDRFKILNASMLTTMGIMLIAKNPYVKAAMVVVGLWGTFALNNEMATGMEFLMQGRQKRKW